MARLGDFYEEDEPLDDIKAAWLDGSEVITAPPQRGVNQQFWSFSDTSEPTVPGEGTTVVKIPVNLSH